MENIAAWFFGLISLGAVALGLLSAIAPFLQALMAAGKSFGL